MQRNDRWPTEYEPDSRSRRNSTSSRGSKKGKTSPPSSATSTPKKLIKQPEFVVTGKQILKKPDRANSLPGSYRRRPSLEAVKPKSAPPKRPTESQASKSRETSLEDDVSLDLSQVSDFEDMNAKYGIKKGPPQATSTPKKRASLPARDLRDQIRDSRDTSKTGLTYRHGVSTDLDYSSVSPEYSGPSSTEASPRQTKGVSQDISSCCVSTWLDSDSETKMEQGEWSRFWANYNGSTVPVSSYYDQCPTPRGDLGLADLDFSADLSRKRSPEGAKTINSIIRNEGLHLTPRETQNIIKCAHILGNVLTKAIERRSKEKECSTDKIQEVSEGNDLKKKTLSENNNSDKVKVLTETDEQDLKKKTTPHKELNTDNIQELAEKDDEKDLKKKTMTLDLKEMNIPLETKEEKRCETVATQTDISLPNTKSAPKIFENILRQLSRSSIDEGLVMKVKDSLDAEVKVEAKE